jgi:hypothetical protein
VSQSKGSLQSTYYGTPGPGALRRTEGKRQCEAPGCTTILSAYNSATLCFRHDKPEKVQGRL